MGFYNSPRIVTDNLVLNLDAGNIKSYAGDVISEIAGPAYGYFGGGNTWPGPIVTTVSRIDYGNDTATAATKGPLSAARKYLAAAGNASYGYFAGGGTPSDVTTVDRIDYSSDTGTTPTKGPLSQARKALGATGNASYGYFGGGSPGTISTVDRIDYSSDTGTTPTKGPLSVAKRTLSAIGNLSYGYFGGGYGPGSASTSVDRVDYSNDTATAVAKGPLSYGRNYPEATGNASYGWWGGGSTPSPASTVDRIDYSSDTPTAAVKGPLSGNRGLAGATGNASYGYYGGGSDGSNYMSSIDRIDYSNDTATAAAKGPLSGVNASMGGASSREYGLPDATTYATRSATAPAGTGYGYFGGGFPGPVSTVDRLDYSSDTTACAVKGPLTQGSYAVSATGNQSYGWFGARRNPSSNQTSYVDRIDYSNDTATASPRGSMSAARYKTAATGNLSYGYFGGGMTSPTSPDTVSSVDRIDYSNDTPTATAKGPLASARYSLTATGTTSYGYFGGGASASPLVYGVTTVERVDYSSDTSTAVAKGPLDTGRFYMATAGNASYGYFSGGRHYPAGNYSLVSRIDYSSDTSTATAKGPLAAVTYSAAGTGNTSYGYTAGGADPNKSTVQRLDYSSDTDTAVAKGPLSAVKKVLGAVSSRINGFPTTSTSYPWYDISGKGDDGENTSGGASYGSAGGGSFTFNGTSNYVSSDDKINLQLGSGNFTLAAWIKPGEGPAGTSYGYVGGGQAPGSSYKTNVDRIDFGNDTATAVAKGPLAVATSDHGTSSSNSYGYFGGGYGPNKSTVQRIDYSSDTSTMSPKGPLSSARYKVVGAGNNNYGYQGSGAPLGGPTPAVSTIDRIDYSNDTATAAVKGPLSAGRAYMGGATGNQSYGYFGGGDTWPSNKVTTVDRIDYSNDTPTATVKGPLGVVSYQAQVVGNDSYGYWTGGRPSGSSVSTVQRIDYGNDTATAPSKGPLDRTTYIAAGTGNNSYGYVAGDFNKTEVSRIDYSSDTSTASPKGPLTITVYLQRGTSSREYGNPSAAQSDNQGIISYSDTSGEENDTTCQLDVNSDGKIKFSGAAGIVTSTSSPTVDTWSHAAVTRTSNTISLYINGVLENTGITTHTFSDYAKVTIGANRPRSTFYKGDISQVRIYKKSLSSDEIQQNFRSLKKRFGL